MATAFLLVLWGGSLAQTGQICDCEIPTASRGARFAAAERANEQAAEMSASVIARHFPFGIPKPPSNARNEIILVQLEWVTWYDSDLRIPIWVGYQLNRADATARFVERKDCFRRDRRLSDEIASFCVDYNEPLFDRGHMVPANDAKRSETAMDNSFLFSNMTPQYGEFNRRIWEHLESKVHRWAEDVGLYVVTGAVFDRNKDGRRDNDSEAMRMKPSGRVAVPSHFYKIVLHIRTDGKLDTISFLLPHDTQTHPDRDGYLNSKIVSIDAIEKLTGINFLPQMARSRQNRLEQQKARSAGRWVTF
jgi:DNA/RNA endonuclease G (NUC1)